MGSRTLINRIPETGRLCFPKLVLKFEETHRSRT